MVHAFPQESVDKYMKNTQRWNSLFKYNRNKYNQARAAMDAYKKTMYGFALPLQSGLYAPWPHEQEANGVHGFNCTTVIPALYLDLESMEIASEIVQFINFRRIQEKKDRKKPFNESHFALIIDVDHRQKYLIDPFWSTFGPVLEKRAHFIKIGKRGVYGAEKREFNQLLYYTPEEFAAMMNLYCRHQ